MPPVFLKAKEYNPSLAAQALAPPPPAVSDYNRQLLIELGLADEDEPTGAQQQQQQQQQQQLASDSHAADGGIAAFYPDGAGSPAGKVVDELRARLEAVVQVLRVSRNVGVQAVQHEQQREIELLLRDQQRQIELLLRGHTSLKGSMGALRRTSKEQEARHQQVQEQLEQQHAAAIREMEGKLEKAITQVQLLQQATRQRQQQQEASSQLALQGASKEAAALKGQLEELQVALSSNERALAEAQQHAEQLAAREAALLVQCSKQQQQLQQLEQQATAQEQQLQQQAAVQQAACIAAEAKAAALAQERVDRLSADAERQMASAAAEAQQLQGACQQLRQQLAAAEAMAAQQAATQQATAIRHAGLQQQLVDAVKAHSELQVRWEQAESARLQLQATAQQLEQQQEVAAARQADLHVQLQQYQADKAALQEALARAQAQCSSAEARAQSLAQQQQQDAAAASADSQRLQWRLSALQTEHQKAQRAAAERIQVLQQEAERAVLQLAAANEAAAQQVASVKAAAAQQVEGFRLKWRDEFEKRRALHNTVIELKGNIRVLARVRPLIEKERTSSGGGGGAEAVTAVTAVNEETLAVAGPVTREFTFDRVLGQSDGQAQVWSEVAGVVSSVLDGYNACILAYGQTGSGKTYTMEGPADDPGVNSRALAELFRLAAERSEISYAFSTSVMEIYNENLIDLLAGSRSDAGDKLDIKEAPGGGLFIPGLHIEPVSGTDEVAAVLQKGRQGRSTFATNMNEHSSRSHLVLSVFITAQDLVKGTSWSSKLHLIDLAGSERVSRSGAEGERLKEAASINKSLSALGDVVAALQARSPHVPYRNSKLTRLLEDALGGSAKTLLLVNVSPAAENVGETRCSLEFASRARKVELRPAARNPDAPPSPAASSGGGSPVKAPPAVLTSHGGVGGSAASSPRVCSTPGRLASASRRGAVVGPGAAAATPTAAGHAAAVTSVTH